MKKTSDSEPGWYEDPEDQTRERFWNGKYWEKNTRQIGEETESPPAIGEFRLGLLFFRLPLQRDNAFKFYAVLCALSAISGVYQEFQSGTRSELIPLMFLGVVPLMALYIYVLFLPYLIYRRRKDKKRGITAEVSGKLSPSKRRTTLAVALSFGVLFLLSFVGGGLSDKNSKVETFLSHQQEINEVLRRYNTEAGAAVGVVRGISDGTLTAGDGIAQFATASSKVTPVLTDLRVSCEGISFPKIEGSGEELAIAKAFNVLKAACEITPKQFLKLQEIFREQVSDTGTQYQLDQLSAELLALNQAKRDAAIEGLEALLPYADESQASLMRTLLEGFKSQ
jgi:hypothetical protein